ncbi:hypothetical protein [Nocardia sp. NPDC051463]|uniref:hypothetical protein n=1 Tax=Nocardia sp. NPDC051463 TaxID=3154845 RepID=UPI00344BA642
MSARLHLPHPHIADRLAEVFERAFHAWPHHAEEAPPREVPEAEDWNEWHHDPEDGGWSPDGRKQR